jgi:hypothetical protein
MIFIHQCHFHCSRPTPRRACPPRDGQHFVENSQPSAAGCSRVIKPGMVTMVVRNKTGSNQFSVQSNFLIFFNFLLPNQNVEQKNFFAMNNLKIMSFITIAP